MKVTPTDTIVASASCPDREPDDKMKSKLYQQVTMMLMNSLMKQKIAEQNAAREKRIEAP